MATTGNLLGAEIQHAPQLSDLFLSYEPCVIQGMETTTTPPRQDDCRERLPTIRERKRREGLVQVPKNRLFE